MAPPLCRRDFAEVIASLARSWGAVLFFGLPSLALADCRVEKYAELPVMMNGRQPIVEGTINGAAASFVADSGAFFSTLWADRVDRFKLQFRNKAELFRLTGASGEVSAHRTTVDDFSLRGLGADALHHVQFLVVGSSIGNEDGVIGQNILGRADAEYDLANGVIRLFHTTGCEKYSLAYWHGNSPVSAMSIRPTTDLQSHILGSAKLNGQQISVLFDTGASQSALALKAARRTGFDPANAERSFSTPTSPLSGREAEVWFARFEDMDLGGEEIRNVRLQVSDFPEDAGFDLLLGIDFFLSHRIFVANSQHKLYFTYNGGPVFTFSDRSAASPPNADAAGAAAIGSAGDPLPDSPAYARRAAAEATRGDFAHAIADLDAAIRLNPNNADYIYQRGIAKSHSHDTAGALADLDQAVKLNPNQPDWLSARGSLRLGEGDEAGAAADFDEVVRLKPAQDNPELDVASIYEDYGKYETAVARISRWIDNHPNDPSMPGALNDRCWYRAQWGKELDQALADCNLALKGRPTYWQALDSRGLVWLRLGNFDKSISDYKSALRAHPRQATSLYGLGLALIRKKDVAEGNSRIQEALAIDSQIGERYKKWGLVP